MRERDLFIAALEFDNPSLRSAYLDEVCGKQSLERSRIERLLVRAAEVGEFLEQPAADLWSGLDVDLLVEGGSLLATAIDPRPCLDNMTDTSEQENLNTAVMGDLPATLQTSNSPTEMLPVCGILFGRYRVDRVLGLGGMGVVYLVEDTRLGRRVAMKIPKFDVEGKLQSVERFRREARTMASVLHRNLCPIFDVDEQDGIQYLTMAYIEGEPLSMAIKNKVSFTTLQIAEVVQKLALALDAAHRANVVHRDLKPANIMIDRYGEPVLMDFGLAWISHEADSRVTLSGAIIGTPAYMSPEQAEGHPEKVGPASDIYSLGAIFYELLTGSPLHSGSVTRVLFQLMHEEPTRPSQICSNIDPMLEGICLKAISRHPQDRFATAADFADALANFLEGRSSFGKRSERRDDQSLGSASPAVASGIVRSSEGPEVDVTQQASRTRWSASVPRVVLASVLLLLGIGTAWTIISNQTKSPPKDVVRPKIVVSPVNQSAIVATTDEPEAPDASSQFDDDQATGAAFAIAPFNAKQAVSHQQKWAAHLGVPVKYTNSIGITFVLIPPGEFTMGSTPSQIRAAPRFSGEDNFWTESVQSESPQHKVIISKPFYIAIHEVTQSQFSQLMGRNPSSFSTDGMFGDRVVGLDTANFPVDTVNWHDASEFCDKLSLKENLKPFHWQVRLGGIPIEEWSGYRLPTEAEWEFACRAGTVTQFWNGDSIVDINEIGWNGQNCQHRTHTVGELRANPFGLYDVHGNVWEWVLDRWDYSYYGQFAEQPAIDPLGPSIENNYHIVRGGFWAAHPLRCISARRFRQESVQRYGHNGFRVVLSVDTQKQ